MWAQAALERGDNVAAAARRPEVLGDLAARYGDALLPLELDVTDPSQAAGVIAAARERFGRLDVVINNAGYALVGAIEEPDEAEVRAEFETNFFGALRVIRAALPVLREQGGGHIIAVSSVAGLVAGPVVGYYHASKWALEAVHESLAREVAGLGIKVTLLEPGAYATEFASQSSLKVAAGLDPYATMRAEVYASAGHGGFGDPQATAEAVLQVVDAENPPLRLILGSVGLPVVRSAYEARLATWDAWREVSDAAQGAGETASFQWFSFQTLRGGAGGGTS